MASIDGRTIDTWPEEDLLDLGGLEPVQGGDYVVGLLTIGRDQPEMRETIFVCDRFANHAGVYAFLDCDINSREWGPELIDDLNRQIWRALLSRHSDGRKADEDA